MSKKTTSLIVGLLASAEAQGNDFNLIAEANEPNMLDSYAQQLGSEAPKNLSAYQKFMEDEKQKKMNYIDNIRNESQAEDLLRNSPPKSYSNDIPLGREDTLLNMKDGLPDPSPQSILETVRRESERRQNAFSEQMREEAEQRQAERAHEEAQRLRAEEEAHMTPDEIDQKRLEAKWRRDFERQQHQKDEEESMKYHRELEKREQEERLKLAESRAKELEQDRKAHEEREKMLLERDQKSNELVRNEIDRMRKEEAAAKREEKEQRKIQRERERKKKEQHKKRKEQRRKDEKEKKKAEEEAEQNRLRRLERLLDQDTAEDVGKYDIERKKRRAAKEQEREIHDAEQNRRREEDFTRTTKDDRRRAHERHKRQREDKRKAEEEQRKKDEEEYRRKMERLHKQQEREQRQHEQEFRATRDKQDAFRKAQEEYGKCIEDEARGLKVYCKEPIDPEQELAVSEFDSADQEFDSLQPWQSESQSNFEESLSEEYENYSIETDLLSLSTLSMESMNTEEMWSLDNEMYEQEDDFNGRRPPVQMQAPPMGKPGRRGKKPKSETIRYPLMVLEGSQPIANYFAYPNKQSEFDENDMRWQVGEDVRFSLSADDNFDGRDVNVHLNLPDDWNEKPRPRPAQPRGHQAPHKAPAPQPVRQPAPQTPAPPQDWRAPGARPVMSAPPKAGQQGPATRARAPMPQAQRQRPTGTPVGTRYQAQDGYRTDMYGHAGRHHPVHGARGAGHARAHRTGPHPQPAHLEHPAHPVHLPHLRSQADLMQHRQAHPAPQSHGRLGPHGQLHHATRYGQQHPHSAHFGGPHHPSGHGRGPHPQHALPAVAHSRYGTYQEHRQHYPAQAPYPEADVYGEEDFYYPEEGHEYHEEELYHYPEAEDYSLAEQAEEPFDEDYFNEDEPPYGDYYNELDDNDQYYLEDYHSGLQMNGVPELENAARKRQSKRKAARRSKTAVPEKRQKKRSRKQRAREHRQHYPVHEDSHYHFQGHSMPHHYRHPSEAPRGIHRHYPLSHAHEWDHGNFSDDSSYLLSSFLSSNDINFDVNDEVRFKLSTSDNFDGRDIDMKLKLPPDMGGRDTQDQEAPQRKKGQKKQRKQRQHRAEQEPTPQPSQQPPRAPVGPQPAPRAAAPLPPPKIQAKRPTVPPPPAIQPPVAEEEPYYGENEEYYDQEYNDYGYGGDYYYEGCDAYGCDDYYGDDDYYGEPYGWDHHGDWGYQRPHYMNLAQVDDAVEQQTSNQIATNGIRRNPMSDRGEQPNARHYPRLPMRRPKKNAKGPGPQPQRRGRAQRRRGPPAPLGRVPPMPQDKFTAFAQQQFRQDDEANYSDQEQDYLYPECEDCYGLEYAEEYDAPHEPHHLPHGHAPPAHLGHFFDGEQIEAEGDYGLDHRRAMTHGPGHPGQYHPSQQHRMPVGHQDHQMQQDGQVGQQQRRAPAQKGRPGQAGQPQRRRRARGPRLPPPPKQPQAHAPVGPHAAHPHRQAHQQHPQPHQAGHQPHRPRHAPPHRSQPRGEAGYGAKPEQPGQPAYQRWQDEEENLEEQVQPQRAKWAKQQPLDLQIDIRNDIPLEQNQLEHALNSEHELSLDSIDWSDNGRPHSHNDAYSIGGLGDFADLNSFDAPNSGIGAEMSVSWTSGGYANASMFSDSYYADMNGSRDYSWYMGEAESDRNQIEVDESWQQFNDLYSNGTSSSYDSDSSNSSSAYASHEQYGNSESRWTSSENEASLSSNSSLSSSSFSSETSSCSSCSESYRNSALTSEDQGLRRNRRRRNNVVPNEPVEPVGVWRYRDGQQVTLEENQDIDGYFMNLTQAEEEMMRKKMCDAEGGFWCNQTVNYDRSNFGFPGFGKHYNHKKRAPKPKPEPKPQKLMGELDPLRQAPSLDELPGGGEQAKPHQAASKTSPLQKELQERKQQPRRPKPETTKRQTRREEPQRRAAAKPARIGDPKNPEVPSLVVQPARERQLIERPTGLSPAARMFGYEDQPHFLQGHGYQPHNQQQQRTEAGMEQSKPQQKVEPQADFEGLDRILQSPTTSQMMRAEPYYYRQDDPALFEPMPARQQQGPLYAQAQKQTPLKPAEKPQVTKTGEPFFAPSSKPTKSPSSQKPTQPAQPKPRQVVQPKPVVQQPQPKAGKPEESTPSTTEASSPRSTPVKKGGEQFVYQPSAAYGKVPESYSGELLPEAGDHGWAPSYLERFPHHHDMHSHHHYGDEFGHYYEGPTEYGHHWGEEYGHEAYHHYSPFADERHDLEYHGPEPHAHLMPHGDHHEPYFGDYPPHYREHGWDTGYHHEPQHHHFGHHEGEETGEFDYFASMFGQKKAQPQAGSPGAKSTPPAMTTASQKKAPLKPVVPGKPRNELDGYGRLPPVPPTTPYERDFPRSYWDAQYAQAQTAIEMLYPHPHEEQTHLPVYHHFLNSDEPNQSEYLALFGAKELFDQLGDMEPRPKRERRRQGGQRSNENALLREWMLLEQGNDDQIQYGQMNLYGAGDLYAQLAQESNGPQRRKWRPKHNHIRDPMTE